MSLTRSDILVSPPFARYRGLVFRDGESFDKAKRGLMKSNARWKVVAGMKDEDADPEITLGAINARGTAWEKGEAGLFNARC